MVGGWGMRREREREEGRQKKLWLMGGSFW